MSVVSVRGFLQAIALLALPLLLHGNRGVAQDRAQMSYTAKTLRAASIDWLGSGTDSHDSIHVYRLTCSLCVDELKESFNGRKEMPSHLYLNTLRDEDRPLAVPLVACALSQDSEAKRDEVFSELLQIYIESSDYYQQHLSEWRELVNSFGSDEFSTTIDVEPWADAINLLDRQNRLLALLDRLKLPDSIPLKDSSRVPVVKPRGIRDQNLFYYLAIPWLHNHNEKSGSGVFGKAKVKLRYSMVELDYDYLLFQWRDFAENASNGTFWHWNTLGEKMLDPGFIEWNAYFLDLPSDAARKKAFSESINRIADLSKKSPVSLLDAIKSSSLLAIPEERKAKRIEEARLMIEDLLLYFRLRG